MMLGAALIAAMIYLGALFWLAAWPVSAMIAIPLRLVLTPLVNRCIALVVEPPGSGY